ncbi:MAG: hypothetical protein LC114_07785 [Bryobacterales bacterium]|nr:hypothetical protein [Bryobacterales bacterium]
MSRVPGIYGDCNLSQSEARRYFESRVPALKGTEHRARAACPLCGASNPSTLSVDFNKGLFHCFRCGSGGDAISFERVLTGASFKAARDRVYELIGRPLPQTNESASERRRLHEWQATQRRAEEVAAWRDAAVSDLRRRWWQFLSDEQRATRAVRYGEFTDPWRSNLEDVAFLASKRALDLEREIDALNALPAAELIAQFRSVNRGAA